MRHKRPAFSRAGSANQQQLIQRSPSDQSSHSPLFSPYTTDIDDGSHPLIESRTSMLTTSHPDRRKVPGDRESMHSTRRGSRRFQALANKVPRAGFPLRAGRTDIARLCHAGHQVVVVLQRERDADSNRVSRYIAQICTPHSPYCELPQLDMGTPTVPIDDRPVWGAHAGIT
jgi:hypothetical protein